MKIRAPLLFLLAGIFCLSSVASAQDVPVKAADLLPQGVDLLYEFNTIVDNPFESTLVYLGTTSIAGVPEETTYENAQKLMEELLGSNTFTVAMDMDANQPDEWGYTTPKAYVSFSVTDEQLAPLLAIDPYVVPEEMEYLGTTYYKMNGFTYGVRLSGLFIITEKEDDVKALIDASINTAVETLGDYAPYKNSREHDAEGSFLSVYINPRYMNQQEMSSDPLGGGMMVDAFGMKPEALEAILAEGFSLAQTADGYDFTGYYEGDPDKLTALGLEFDRYNFVPGLYKLVSGENIIFYTEGNNLAGGLADTMNMFDSGSEVEIAYEDMKSWTWNELGIVFDEDVLPFLTGKYALAAHSANQVYPAITAIFDTEGETAKAAALVASVSTKMKMYFEETEKEKGTEFYTYRIDYLNGAPYYAHVFDIAALSDSADFTATPADQTTLTVRMGLASDGLIIVSSHPDVTGIMDANDQGMLGNADFASAYTNRTEETGGISYIHAAGLHDYLQTLMLAMNADISSLMLEEDLLAPWKDVFAVNYASKYTAWGKGTARVDTAGLMEYWTLLSDYMDAHPFDPGQLMPIPGTSTFCDVMEGEWYYFYVTTMGRYGIINGYEDGCFHPAREVTRAEFTKLIVETANYQGVFPWSAMSGSDIFFDDVQPGEWYSYYVNQAAAIGYVEGYGDGTFHPNAPITRAEAAQMLARIGRYETLGLVTEPFSDVEDLDWYSNAVRWNYGKGIFTGVTPDTFEPARSLTRAEAVKIIYQMFFQSDVFAQ